MGGEPYFYLVRYRPDIEGVLHELREQEFQAGRYNPVIPFLMDLFPVGPHSPAPGAQHASIAAAFAAADADGTRSILDLERVAEEPDYGAVVRLSDANLEELFGTTRPTREMVLEGDFWDDIERGQGIYIVVYKDNTADEIFFAGYSYD